MPSLQPAALLASRTLGGKASCLPSRRKARSGRHPPQQKEARLSACREGKMPSPPPGPVHAEGSPTACQKATPQKTPPQGPVAVGGRACTLTSRVGRRRAYRAQGRRDAFPPTRRFACVEDPGGEGILPSLAPQGAFRPRPCCSKGKHACRRAGKARCLPPRARPRGRKSDSLPGGYAAENAAPGPVVVAGRARALTSRVRRKRAYRSACADRSPTGC